MIRQIYEVETTFYHGYASSLKEAEELEKKFKLYDSLSGVPITASGSHPEIVVKG